MTSIDKLSKLANSLVNKYSQMSMPSAGPADPTGQRAGQPGIQHNFAPAKPDAAPLMASVKKTLVPGSLVTPQMVQAVEQALNAWVASHDHSPVASK